MHPAERLKREIGRPSTMFIHAEAGGPITYPVVDEASYRAFALEKVAQRFGYAKPLTERPEQPPSRVNHGRWVCDCACGSCAAVAPELDIAICCECGNVYRPLVPPDWQEAERVLLERPAVETRSFYPFGLARTGRPPQSMADLRTENVRHGLGRSG